MRRKALGAMTSAIAGTMTKATQRQTLGCDSGRPRVAATSRRKTPALGTTARSMSVRACAEGESSSRTTTRTPQGAAAGDDAGDDGDNGAQMGGGLVAAASSNRFELVEADDLAVRLDQHFFVQFGLAAEVVVDGRHVGAGTGADLLARRSRESLLGVGAAGGLEDLRARRH